MSQISPLPSLEAIFEAAPCGLLVCQAIRDASGRINDFRAIRAIAAVTRLLGFTQEVILGQTMLETQPNVKPTGLFDRYIAVTETGVPFEADVFLDDHWCNGSVVKLGDGFMITFVNVDETKAALRREAEVNAPPGCHGRCPGVPRVLRRCVTPRIRGVRSWIFSIPEPTKLSINSLACQASRLWGSE